MNLAGQAAPRRGVERRKYQRRHVPLRVEVSGINKKGEKFACDALLHNISEGGILMRITHPVKKRESLVVLIHSTEGVRDEHERPFASATGTVLRTKRQPLDTCDVAVRFDQPLPAHFDMMG